MLKLKHTIIALVLGGVSLLGLTYIMDEYEPIPVESTSIVVLASNKESKLDYTLAMKRGDGGIYVRIGTSVDGNERVDHYLNEGIADGNGLYPLYDWLNSENIPNIQKAIDVYPDPLMPSVILHLPGKTVMIKWQMDQVERGVILGTTITIDYLDNGISGLVTINVPTTNSGLLTYTFDSETADADMGLLQKLLMDDSITALVDISEYNNKA